MKRNLIYPEESYKIMGDCFEVYKRMGCGFLENVYQECLEIEFGVRKIPFQTQQKIKLFYREQILTPIYKPDFICYDKIIVEIKAVSKIANEHKAQIINYLHATTFKLGILINFGHYPKVESERFVLEK